MQLYGSLHLNMAFQLLLHLPFYVPRIEVSKVRIHKFHRHFSLVPVSWYLNWKMEYRHIRILEGDKLEDKRETLSIPRHSSFDECQFAPIENRSSLWA